MPVGDKNPEKWRNKKFWVAQRTEKYWITRKKWKENFLINYLLRFISLCIVVIAVNANSLDALKVCTFLFRF